MGASRGNPKKLGLGACIRNCNGFLLAIMVYPIMDRTNNIIEAQALLIGLALVKKGQFHRVNIEGDSQVIINAYIKREIFNWKLNYILQQIWILMDQC